MHGGCALLALTAAGDRGGLRVCARIGLRLSPLGDLGYGDVLVGCDQACRCGSKGYSSRHESEQAMEGKPVICQTSHSCEDSASTRSAADRDANSSLDRLQDGTIGDSRV